jgi:hypothetical protein
MIIGSRVDQYPPTADADPESLDPTCTGSGGDHGSAGASMGGNGERRKTNVVSCGSKFASTWLGKCAPPGMYVDAKSLG